MTGKKVAMLLLRVLAAAVLAVLTPMPEMSLASDMHVTHSPWYPRRLAFSILQRSH
jgi:hypothetical protein